MGLWGEDYWSHHIRPSRPTGCLRHGNVQFVPCCPIRLVPEQSDPIRWKNFSPSWQKHALCNHCSIIRDLGVSQFCLFFFFYFFQELSLTHSVEDASSVSAASPDCGTISSSRAELGLSLPRLAKCSSSETKNCGENTECESTAYSQKSDNGQINLI